MIKKSIPALLSIALVVQGTPLPLFAQETPMEEIEKSTEQKANMEGFLNWIINDSSASSKIKNDAKEALKIFGDGVLDKDTDLNDPNDATSLKNIKASLPHLDECNRLRQLPEHGLSPLRVSLQLMVIAQKQLNWSDTGMNHSQAYLVGENLSWGYEDPFEGWYFEEKKVYDKDKGASGVVGHYLNIINKSYTATGFAHNNNGKYGWNGEVDGQVFSSSGGTMTVDELNDLLHQFEATLPSTSSPTKPDIDTPNEPNTPALPTTPVTPSNPTPSNPTPSNSTPSNPDQNTFVADDPLDVKPTNVTSTQKASLYRLYNQKTGEHFYTLSDGERNQLLAQNWNDEGQGWNTPKSSAYPIYRLLNPNTGDHHYTVDENEYLILSYFLGWIGEGIRFYSAHPDDEEAIVLYRLYNPNAVDTGIHHYTTDKHERDVLVSLGWQDEGIAWYALP